MASIDRSPSGCATTRADGVQFGRAATVRSVRDRGVAMRTSTRTATTVVSPARSWTTTPSSATQGPNSRDGPSGQFLSAHPEAAESFVVNATPPGRARSTFVSAGLSRDRKSATAASRSAQSYRPATPAVASSTASSVVSAALALVTNVLWVESIKCWAKPSNTWTLKQPLFRLDYTPCTCPQQHPLQPRCRPNKPSHRNTLHKVGNCRPLVRVEQRVRDVCWRANTGRTGLS